VNLFNKIYQSLLVEQNILVISLTVLLFQIIHFTWFPILPIYLKELGASDFQAGFSYTLLAFSITIMQFLGGILSDCYGRKWLIIIPSFALIPLLFLAGRSSHWFTLMWILVVINSLSSIQIPSLLSIIAESTPPSKRGIAFGKFGFFAMLGSTIGAFLGSILILHVGIKYLFYLNSFIELICVSARIKWLKETHHNHFRANYSDSFRKLFNKKMLTIILAFSSLVILYNLTTDGPFISLYANDIMKLDKSKINLLFSILGLTAVMYSIWGGKIVDKWGSKKILICSVIGLAISVILWSYTSTLLSIIVLIMLVSIFSQSCRIAYNSFLSDITHHESRGVVIGFIGTFTGLTGSIGPLLGGYLKIQFGPQSPFWAGLIFSIITLLLLAKVKN